VGPGIGATGLQTPNKQSGFGVVDAGRALEITPAQLVINASPPSGTVTANSTPTITFLLDAADVQGFTLSLNGTVIFTYMGPGAATDPRTGASYDPATGLLTIKLPFASSAFPIPQNVPLVFTISAFGGTVSSTSPQTFSTTLTIQPMFLQPGLSFIGIPYGLTGQAAVPEYVFSGSPFKLARWDPAAGRYHIYPGYAFASFAPPGATGTVPDPPAGLGYWVSVPTTTALHIEGTDVPLAPYAITLRAGWNQVGNPFPFRIDWSNSQASANGNTVPVGSAGQAGIISPTAFTFGGGRYNALSAPATSSQPINAFQGFWVFAFQNSTLFLQPNPLFNTNGLP